MCKIWHWAFSAWRMLGPLPHKSLQVYAIETHTVLWCSHWFGIESRCKWQYNGFLMLLGILELFGLVRGPVALRTQCFDFASRFCGADCFALIASEENTLWSYGPSRRFAACNAMPIMFVYTASAKCFHQAFWLTKAWGLWMEQNCQGLLRSPRGKLEHICHPRHQGQCAASMFADLTWVKRFSMWGMPARSMCWPQPFAMKGQHGSYPVSVLLDFLLGNWRTVALEVGLKIMCTPHL